MLKIFRCECRRLLCNKFFIGLLAVLLFYAGQVFYAVALPGVAHTAPFSPWSFGAYLGRLLPLVWVGALFFLTFFTSARERRAAVLTAATPADPRRYAQARCAAALVGVALLCLAALALAALLYARLFGWTDWGSLALPALVILAPPLVFALGSGWLLGRLRPWLLYVWMLLPFAGGPGAVERRPVHVLSPDSGDAGPGFLPPGGGLGRPRAASGCRGAPFAGGGKGEKGV